MVLALALAMTPLIGCVTVHSNATKACPQIVEYKPEFQAAAKEQLLTLPASSPIAIMIPDYGRLRDQARECWK